MINIMSMFHSYVSLPAPVLFQCHTRGTEEGIYWEQAKQRPCERASVGMKGHITHFFSYASNEYSVSSTLSHNQLKTAMSKASCQTRRWQWQM
uniref:Uncharacterized protein n=1 Tax=Rhizophora mucronata TaxID=61149 RepID=A0A2P2IIN8_RHIMU